MKAVEARIQSIKNGNQDAFRKLVLEYQSMVYTLCMRIILDESLAEEATQDVFVKIYKKISGYNYQSSLKTWIYRIAYNTAIDYTRSKKRLKVQTGLEVLDRTPNDLADAEQKIIVSERNAYIETCIRKLKKEEAAVISLFYLEEMSVKEISLSLGMSESNVKVRLFRARKTLAKLIDVNVMS